MKRLNNAMNELESNEFFATLSVASDPDIFVRLMRVQPAVKTILSEAYRDSVQVELAIRLNNLLEEEFDPAYLRASDTAIAAYLWILAHVGSRAALFLAERTLASSNLWWAAKVAQRVVSKVPVEKSIPVVTTYELKVAESKLPAASFAQGITGDYFAIVTSGKVEVGVTNAVDMVSGDSFEFHGLPSAATVISQGAL